MYWRLDCVCTKETGAVFAYTRDGCLKEEFLQYDWDRAKDEEKQVAFYVSYIGEDGSAFGKDVSHLGDDVKAIGKDVSPLGNNVSSVGLGLTCLPIPRSSSLVGEPPEALMTQQTNTFDCGVHVLYIITKLIEAGKDGKLLEYLENGGLPKE
ncbi:hypothetical protein R1sor_018046 [Riccia sorocarpa]|uniref:Ubiquitin-like protease family profile domain-containing protein n=1 Tax=Riccia sorocarpa TaxID=122646 RepID=A0ABD3IEU0_9MARC